MAMLTGGLVAGALLGAGAARGHEPKDTTRPTARTPADAKSDADRDHHHDDPEEHGEGHVHAPVPLEYKSAHIPASAWTDSRLIARGKQVYVERCSVCHGETGDGKGPAGVALPLKPPDLRDERMIGEMTGNYWFWRVSEGGAAEPFKSNGSTMPAWKDVLSVEDRWAVIAYQHTFSNHEGPHVTSEHPQMIAPAHVTHSPAGPGPVPAAHGQGHKH
jgi:mono/diheme cytochrome c family protein